MSSITCDHYTSNSSYYRTIQFLEVTSSSSIFMLNHVDYLIAKEADLNFFTFDHTQINIQNLGTLPINMKPLPYSKLFEMVFKNTSSLENHFKSNAEDAINSTFAFLSDRSDILNSSKDTKALFEHNWNLSKQTGFAKYFINFFRSFNSPYRILIICLFAYFIYSILYMHPWAEFNKCLNFSDYFYFSGLTFTTIGYGDITPTSVFSKFLAISEGATGVLLLSSFIVALTNKYTK